MHAIARLWGAIALTAVLMLVAAMLAARPVSVAVDRASTLMVEE